MRNHKKKDNVATIVMIAAFIAACVLGINVDLYSGCKWDFWYNPDILEQTEEKSMIYIQLFLSFFQISLVQLWRWICGTSTDPGAGRKCASLA